jgi:hypothetical protein
MDYLKQARAIRAERPPQLVLKPDPVPFVGRLKLQRRRDGGYLVTAIASDGQAGQFADGSLAAEVVAPADLDRVQPEDLLSQALERAHDRLNRLRLEAAFRLIAQLRGDRDDQTLVAMLQQALEEEGPG